MFTNKTRIVATIAPASDSIDLLDNPPFGVDWKVVTNRKRAERRGKIQLIDAREHWTPMKHQIPAVQTAGGDRH